MIPDPAGKRSSAAVVILFTTEPTDRALAGWCAAD
jgi:hypothetical protein